MPYDVRLSRSARNYLLRLDRRLQRRIRDRLRDLARDPYAAEYSKPLTNEPGLRSARVGDYRIVYEVTDAVHILDVLRIGPRGRVYRGL